MKFHELNLGSVAQILLGLAVGMRHVQAAVAQAWPSKRVTIVVGVPAGVRLIR